MDSTMYCFRIWSLFARSTLISHFNRQVHTTCYSSYCTRNITKQVFLTSVALQHQRRALNNSFFGTCTGCCGRKYDSFVNSVNSLKNANERVTIPSKEQQINEEERGFRTKFFTFDLDGYISVDDLVKFLLREGAMDLCVIKTSGKRKAYVDYFVVVSGASSRHLRAMAKNLEYQFRGHEVRAIGKSGHVTVEGLESNHWLVVDIGNAVVHFFLPEVREIYELEKLWTLGPQYDDQYRAMLEDDEQLGAFTHFRRTGETDNSELE